MADIDWMSDKLGLVSIQGRWDHSCTHMDYSSSPNYYFRNYVPYYTDFGLIIYHLVTCTIVK